jgi:hypothetical protein
VACGAETLAWRSTSNKFCLAPLQARSPYDVVWLVGRDVIKDFKAPVTEESRVQGKRFPGPPVYLDGDARREPCRFKPQV